MPGLRVLLALALPTLAFAGTVATPPPALGHDAPVRLSATAQLPSPPGLLHWPGYDLPGLNTERADDHADQLALRKAVALSRQQALAARTAAAARATQAARAARAARAAQAARVLQAARAAQAAQAAQVAQAAQAAQDAQNAQAAQDAARFRATQEARASRSRAIPPRAVPAPAAPAAGDPREYARSLLASRGQGDQFGCLNSLWERESGWQVSASNASSGAYGIPQSLPGDKMASTGSDWQTNAATQIQWGLGYISERYGSPCGAWGHSQANGWY